MNHDADSFCKTNASRRPELIKSESEPIFHAETHLVPKHHSSGGKQVLGRTSKMGQRDIRRLLIIGAMTVIRWACRKAPPENSWRARMLARKPRMLVTIALANKMARSIWAMMTKNEDYKDSALTAA